MASDLTSAELTLLGLVVEQPRHGYELEVVITERGMREWTEIGFSSIYYLLTRLRERGLIEYAEPSQSGNAKARKVYVATAEGRQACAAAAEEAIARPDPVFPRVLVGLANQPAIDDGRLLGALERRSRALTERVEHIRRAASEQPHAPEFVRAIFDYTLGQLTAEQAWLARYQASLSDTHGSGGEARMAPYDVKREHKDIYAPKNTTWAVVDVPQQQFIAIDGKGNPNTAPEYASAVEALYSVAYTLKFASKRGEGGDFVVAPLEGLWWADQYEAFTTGAKDSWNWTMLISMPSWITEEMIEDAKQTALAKKKLPAISQVRHHILHEGPSAQLLHTGPYDDEAPVLHELHHTYLAANGLQASGLHHEIYLSDARKTAPEKLKTILRQPVKGLSQ
ncbi:DNA-binding PadR family transcriptional regulator [Catenulispora sp. GP43]|uniref:GyrI-like domain-containing protein n=1 Tax=Catenulispora sp. GP43 TaxID=3156263 RepID=UPI003511E931